MGQNQLSVELRKVYKSLTPSTLLAVEVNSSVARLYIVSSAFKDLTLDERCDLLIENLEQNSTEFHEKYAFIFEPFTLEEVISGNLKISEEIQSLIDSNAAAASAQNKTNIEI